MRGAASNEAFGCFEGLYARCAEQSQERKDADKRQWFGYVLRQGKCASSWLGFGQLYAALGLLVALLLLLTPKYAYALAEGDYARLWGPNVVSNNINTDEKLYGVVVCAPNAFDAAAVDLGYKPYEFTDEQRALLSNESTGGSFYTYAQTFSYIGTRNDPNYPDWGGMASDVFDMWGTMLGRENVWWSEYSSALRTAAGVDLRVILAGGSTGGGGSPGTPEVNTNGWYRVVLSANCAPYSNDMANTQRTVYDNPTVSLDSSTGIGTVSGGTSGATISYNTLDTLVMYIDPYSMDYIKQNGYDIVSYVKSLDYVYLVTQEYDFSYYKLGIDSSYGVENISGNVNLGKEIASSSRDFYRVDGEVCCFFTNATISRSWKLIVNEKYGWLLKPFWNTYNGEVTSPPSVPPTQWPDPPETPAVDPPEVPTPTEPTLPTEPVEPDPPVTPTYPIQVVYQDVTYVTADISAILDALNEHCRHLQDAIYNAGKDLYDSLSAQLSNLFKGLSKMQTELVNWLGNVMSELMDTWTDYFHDTMEWLAEQFDYSVSGSGYDDETVVSWLKKIWYKLGTGGNTRPVDPVAQPVETGSWLDTLIKNLFTALTDIFGGLRDGLAAAVQGLSNKFPFSIPWDIAAMLAMLAATPEVPEFDMPAYTVSMSGGLQQVGTYHIDLQDYDAYVGAVRWMILFVWVGYLMAHTKEYMELLEKVVGFGA